MMRRRPSVIAVVALIAVAVAAPGASAKGVQVLRVTPLSPTATDAIGVSFNVPARLTRDDRIFVSVAGTHTGACASDVNVFVPRAKLRPGRTGTAVLQPNQGGRFAGWCSGSAEVTVYRATKIPSGYAIGARLAHKPITIRHAVGFNPEREAGTQVRIDVLPESTATVRAAGRADRVLGLGGAIDGWIPGKFVLNSDYTIGLGYQIRRNVLPVTGDDVFVASLVPDPLCSAPSIQTATRVAPGTGSSMTFYRDGHITGRLILAADPTLLAGCAGPATGTTTIDLAGSLGVKKLADLTVTGTIPGVPVGSGLTGTVTVSLDLKVNILD